MNSLTAPSTPNQSPTFHRSFTLPSRLNSSPRSRVSERTPEPDAVETLFTQQAAKIVTFNASSPSSQLRSVSLGNEVAQNSEVVGTLPWVTHSERTIAAGQIRIYRVPGSVAFLSSGQWIHALLPKSQCWCVDGESRFVLRGRQNTFYRVDLPNACLEDRRLADEFKLELSRLLQYETTSCPFKRGFHVDLPEGPQAPKKPWRPKHQPDSLKPTPIHIQNKSAPSTASLSNEKFHIDNAESCGPSIQASAKDARSHKLEGHFNTTRLGRGGIKETVRDQVAMSKNPTVPFHYPASSGQNLPTIVDTETSAPSLELTAKTPPIEPTLRLRIQQASHSEIGMWPRLNNPATFAENVGPANDNAQTLDGIEVLLRTEDLPIGTFRWLEDTSDRDFSIRPSPPPKFQLVTGLSETKVRSKSSSISPEEPLKSNANDPETSSTVSSVDSLLSFHSFQSPISPMPPSPPSSGTISYSKTLNEMRIDVPGTRQKKQTKSELAINPESLDSSDEISIPNGSGDSPTILTHHERFSHTKNHLSSKSSMRAASPSTALRQRLSRRRAHSPLPSPANLYTPRAQLSGHHLTSAILQKTCSIILGPPVQLVALMLNLAARFASGTLKGESYTYRERGQPIPCSWELSEDEKENEGKDEWEDDYGFSLGDTPEQKRGRRMTDDNGGSWEID